MSDALRPYRLHLRVMGQTSPPALAQPVLSHVLGSEVLDVGCGSGLYGYLMRVAWHFTGSWNEERVSESTKLTGLDFSSVAIERLRCFGFYDELLLADSGQLPVGDGAFDTVLSMENLEHLFSNEVLPALKEMRRAARRRLVISTPAPWMVINHRWLRQEIADAEADPVAMNYDEFVLLVGCLHKSSLAPDQMKAIGFQVQEAHGRPTTVHDSLIYWADVEDLRLDQLTSVIGMSEGAYPADDGRGDWRSEYLTFLRASQAIDTGYDKPRRSFRSLISAARAT